MITRDTFVTIREGDSRIDLITKEDLLRLVNLTLNENVEFDEYCEDNIRNQAHQIIYKSVFRKLKDLSDRKQEFTDESERMYLQEYEKYRGELPQNGDIDQHSAV